MLKRLKLNFMIASLMLGLIFASVDEAKAQVACPGVPFDIGWLQLGVSTTADFTAGLLGTIESSSGIDWMHSDAALLNTELSGSQLVTWWSQAGGRNTSLQVTNVHPTLAVSVHVQIFGPDCIEVRDFCDTFTPNDTHVYDLGNLVSNLGQDIPEGNFQDTEGFLTVTAVNACPGARAAISFDALIGNVVINSSDVEYGTNVYARLALGTFQGTLSDTNPYLTPASPTTLLSEGFSIVEGGATAGADLVLISFDDFYGPPYTPLGNFLTRYTPGITDDVEQFLSCASFSGCFVRLGVDDALVNSGGFTPTPSPTATPTASPIPCEDDIDCPLGQVCVGAVEGACDVSLDPCFEDADCPEGEVCDGGQLGVCQAPTPSPTATPTDGGDGGGGGCVVAGPVSVGTAMANILLPLVPVGFAFGLRALRRRNRKEEK